MTAHHVLLVGALMAAFTPAVVHAQFCPTLTTLTARTPQTVVDQDRYGIAQGQSSWCAVGLQPDPLSQWSLLLYQSVAAFPTCLIGELGNAAAYDSVAYFVGDFTGGPGEAYARPILDSAGDARLEWDPGSGELFYEQMSCSDLIRPSFLRVWELNVVYPNLPHYVFLRTGAAQGTLSVFRNASGTPGTWLTSSQALARVHTNEVPIGAFEARVLPFTPPAAGRYAVVFARENDADAALCAGWGYCGSPVLFSSGTAYTSTFGTYRVAFDQPDTAWAAVGVRGTSDDWEISLYRGIGGPYPECLSDLVTTSKQAPSGVEFVIGNFHRNPRGTYFAFASDANLLPPQLTQGTVEFDGGPDVLTVNGNAALRGTNANDVLETWDVYLEAGRTYDIEFTHVPGVDARVLLFGTQAPTYFAHRQGRLLESAGWAVYTAPYSGWYGVVVVNDNGGTGTYTLRISTEVVGAQPALSGTTRLLGVAPNPSRVDCRIEYELARPGRVEMDVVELRGRRVRRLAEIAEAGKRALVWDGRDESGAPVPAGVYLVRLRVDGNDAGERKLTRVAR